jgi:hypothetical protein
MRPENRKDAATWPKSGVKEFAVWHSLYPDIYGISSRSLFVLANRSHFYTLESVEALAGGRQVSGIPSLS